MTPWAPEFIINKVFPGMRNGFFIEAGAARGGRDESNTYLLEKNYGWSGICVEPNRAFFEILVATRSAHCVNACLHEEDGEVDFISAGYFGTVAQHVEEVFATHGITDRDNLIQSHENYRQDVDGPATMTKMPARSLASLLTELGYDGEVHYLSLDVEGGELFVLKGYPFERNKLLSATVECHFPYNGAMYPHQHCLPVRELMRNNGLVFLRTEFVDDIFIHVDLLRARF